MLMELPAGAPLPIGRLASECVQSTPGLGREATRREPRGCPVKIDKNELLHGAALAQLTKHDAFTSLNKASDHYGHYLINGSVRLWTKYRSGPGPAWQFAFSYDEVTSIGCDEVDHPDETVQIVLVCGHTSICVLPVADLWQVIDPDQMDASQVVSVSAPAGRSMRVKGPRGRLGQTVPHAAFPARVLDGTKGSN